MTTTQTPLIPVGILGGTYDPVHSAHIGAAVQAKELLRLSLVYLMVTPHNPEKEAPQASLFHRMAMLRLAIPEYAHSWLQASDAECFFTPADTEARTLLFLKAFQRCYPEVQPVWLMGSDCFKNFPTWLGWESIMKHFPVAVFCRGTSPVEDVLAYEAARRYAFRYTPWPEFESLPGQWCVLPPRNNHISSHTIRERIRSGDGPVDFGLHEEGIWPYIQANGLYGCDSPP